MSSHDSKARWLPENNSTHRTDHSDNEIVGSGSNNLSFSRLSSGALNRRPSQKSTRFTLPESTIISSSSSISSSSNNNIYSNDEGYVEIVLHIHDDSVAVHSIRNAGGAGEQNLELVNGLDKRSSSGLSGIFRNASSQFKQVSEVLKRLAPLTKRQTPGPLDRTNPAATSALKGLEFITKTDDGTGWTAVEKTFELLTSTTNGLLPRRLFGICIGMNKDSEAFAGRLFNALARQRNITSDDINRAQLKEFWDQMANEDFDSRLQTFFYMVDKDADGRITEAEVREIIKLSASANKLLNLHNQADEYAALIMEELDPENLGYIMIESLEMLLLQASSQVRGKDNQISSQMLSKEFKTADHDRMLRKWHQYLKYIIEDNWKRAWVMVLWISAMAGLFTWKYLQYRNKGDIYDVMGHCVCMAKGAAETLKLNMALILLPVCRNTITWLRSKTKLGKVVPFDDNLIFHQMIAVGIAFGVGIHAIYHLSCDFPRLLHASEEKYEPMKKYFGEQPSSYFWFVRGWEVVTGITMVTLMAIAFTLASPWLRRGEKNLPKFLKNLPASLKKHAGYNAFWYSHHLFVIVYACLIIHGIKLYFIKEWYRKTTWMYIAVPVILYGSERLIRTFRSWIKGVKIQKVVVHPEKVLALYMSKPKNFKYNSGQYIFVKCVTVSPFEWHPFSITSSPGDNYLSVHIQNSGDWTRKIVTVFSEVCQPMPYGESGLLRAECILGSYHQFPRVMIDGPYGAPSQDYKKYEVVLLVGLGIGATPMISIVKDIINKIKARDDGGENIMENGLMFSPDGSPLSSSSPSPMLPKSKRKSKGPVFKTKKAYFYWVTREQGSFDWFKEVMNEVAELDDKGVIEMHTYCTSVYGQGDARSALIEMIQFMNHAKNGVDVVSGTRVKTHFAKPKWRDVYKRIALNHKESKIGVFYCGRAAPIKELKQLASDFSHDTSTSTKFDFHKENF